jgi:acyl carrier protein
MASANISITPQKNTSHFMPDTTTTDFYNEIAELMIESLNLEVEVADIGLDDPLYGDGLGLDSIDVLEIALVVSKRYGLQLRADSADNEHIFASLRNLADHITAQRTR